LPWTYLRFSILVYHLTANKNGNVVLLLLLKYVVRHSHDLDGADLKAGFLESLSLGAGEEALAVIEMTAWELDSAWLVSPSTVLLLIGIIYLLRGYLFACQ
jgi:hypothetical protein